MGMPDTPLVNLKDRFCNSIKPARAFQAAVSKARELGCIVWYSTAQAPGVRQFAKQPTFMRV